MASNFDYDPAWKPEGQGSSNFDFDPNWKPQEPSGLVRRALGDTAVSLAKGVIGAGEAAVGLANLPTAGGAGKLLEGIGYDPKAAKETLDTLYSPEQQRANQAVQQASGFMGKAGAMLQNPSTIAQSVAESVPLMLGGGALAQGLGKAGMLAGSPVMRGAIGEGLTGAGLAAEGTRQETEDGMLTPGQVGTSLASGAGTALIGAAGGKIAQKLGIGDVDTMLAQGAIGQSAKGRARRFVEGAISEGVLEEMPQSAQEQVWQNLALGRPWDENVPESAATGLIAGLAMGGGAGALPSTARPAQPAQPTQPPQPAIDPNAGPLSKAASMATQTPELNPLAFTPMQPTGPELETTEQEQARMRAAQFQADAMPFEPSLSFEQGPQPVRATTQDGMPFERIGPEDYDTLNPIRAGEGELLDAERPAAGRTRAPDAIEGQDQRRIGVADDGQQGNQAPMRTLGERVQPAQGDNAPTRALPYFTDQKAEQSARKALPFATEQGAQKKAVELSKKRNEPFTVIPHPALADRFAVVPFRNLRTPNEQGQAAQLAARAQAGQPGTMPRVEQGAQQSAPDGLAATAPAASVQTQPATESVTNGLPPSQQVATQAQEARGQEGAKETRDELLARYKRAELFSDESFALSDRLKDSTRKEVGAKIAAGEMPVFDTGSETFATITPSAQKPGSFQVTRYNRYGVMGDSQYASVDDALAREFFHQKRMVPQAEAEQRFAESLQAEAKYQSARNQQSAQTQPQGERNGLQEEGRREEVAPKPKNQTLDSLQAEYNKTKSALDAIGPEPYQPKKRGSNPTEEDAKAFDEAQKRYRSWRNKYLRLKKAEVDASNRLFYAKKAEQQQSETTAREEAQADQSPSDRFRAEVERRKQERDKEFVHNGVRIYPATINVAGERKQMWGVESSENKAKREAGERYGFGDSLFDTKEQATAAADRQIKRDSERSEFERQRAEEDASKNAKAAERRADTINGFLEGKAPNTQELIRKALDKQYRFDGAVRSVRQQVEWLNENGALEVSTFEEPKIKPMSRTQFNRASQREQDAHEKKMRDAGTKTVYLVSGSELGKYAYDYAQHLIARKPAAPQQAQEQPKQAAPQLEGARRDPTKVSLFNPYQDGDVVSIDGKDWQVRQDMPGWYLTSTGNWRGTHPTIQRIRAMADLIREVEQAYQASESTDSSQQAEPFPVNPELKSLFESLDGTSTRKANKAKKAIQSDPRADKINMVQDKFLDILQALEDSGAVKINCK